MSNVCHISSCVKIYENTNYSKGKIVFALSIKRELHIRDNEIIYIKVSIKPEIVQAPIYKKQEFDTWSLIISKYDLETRPFKDGLFLPIEFQGIKLGQLILNLLIKEGKDFFPDKEAIVMLGAETQEKKITIKENFYKKFGFEVNYDSNSNNGKGSARIDAFKNLITFDTTPKGIKELDIIQEVQNMFKIEEELKTEKQKKNALVESCHKDEENILKYKNLFVVSLVSLSAVLFYIVKYC